jgi:hypothetical protein
MLAVLDEVQSAEVDLRLSRLPIAPVLEQAGNKLSKGGDPESELKDCAADEHGRTIEDRTGKLKY